MQYKAIIFDLDGTAIPNKPNAMPSQRLIAAIELRVPPNSEVLSMVAEPVGREAIASPEIQALIDQMFRVAHGRQGDAQYPTLVGLAAPQIGIPKRIVLIGMNAAGAGEQPELKAFVDPEVVWASDETEEGREGCFSTSRVCGIVERAKQVIVKAFDRDGNEFTHQFEGFPARVAQHEVDHLDGIRFPDRITDDRNLHWVEEEEFGDYRQRWQEWPKHCSRNQWEAIKAPAAPNPIPPMI